MTDAGESTLAWLDLSEKSRQEMQEYLALLAEPGTLDELGTGQIRDVFSGLFFPGTSTLWARARYLLFVPWIYQDLERDGTGRRTGRDAARKLQAKLIRALKTGGDEDGLIGRRVLEPVNMPDDLLWNGLHSWGIRVHEGSLSKYQRSLEGGAGFFDVLRGDNGETLDAAGASWWNQRLPYAPDGYLDRCRFDLTREEAEFLRDQLHELHPRSLLARAIEGKPVETMGSDNLWDCADLVNRLDPEMQDAVEDARVFAFAMQGAGITYSYLMTAKKHGPEEDPTNDLAAALAAWAEEITANGAAQAISNWRRTKSRFWSRATEINPGIRPGTTDFVDAWMKLAVLPPREILSRDDVLELIRDREWDVKRNLARLSNSKALDNAAGISGTGLLPFRWYQARRICDDIRQGLAKRR